METLTPSQLSAREDTLRNTAIVFGRVARALTKNRNIDVEFAPGAKPVTYVTTNTGHWTGGPKTTIRLQTPTVQAMYEGNVGNVTANLKDLDVMSGAIGALYHELSHIWFGVGGFRVSNMLAFGILEDMRIEALTIALYPAVQPFLESDYWQHVADGAWPLEHMHLYAAGRVHLPQQHRDQMAAAFEIPTRADEVQQIMDAYRNLGPMLPTPGPKDTAKVQALVNQLARIINSMAKPPAGAHAHRPDEADTFTVSVSSGDANADRSDADELRKEDEAAAQAGAGDGEDGDGDGAGSGDADGDSDGGDQPGKGNGAGQGQQPGSGDGGGQKPGQQPGDGSKPGQGAGYTTNRTGQERPPTPAQLRETAAQKIKVLSTNPDLVQELHDMRDAVLMTRNQWKLDVIPQEQPVTTELRHASERFANEVRKCMAEDVDPGWDARHSSGRLNVSRYLGGAELDEVFDRWTEDLNVEYGVNAGLLIDISGSMDHKKLTAVSQGAWIIRSGYERLENTNVNTMLYDTDVYRPYKAGPLSKTTWGMFASNGGTNPVTALVEMEQWLAGLDAKTATNVIYILTDGDWTYNHWGKRDGNPIDVMDRLRAKGVIIVLVGIGGVRFQFRQIQSSDHAVSISTDPLAYVAVAQRVTQQVYRRIAAGQRNRKG